MEQLGRGGVWDWGGRREGPRSSAEVQSDFRVDCILIHASQNPRRGSFPRFTQAHRRPGAPGSLSAGGTPGQCPPSAPPRPLWGRGHPGGGPAPAVRNRARSLAAGGRRERPRRRVHRPMAAALLTRAWGPLRGGECAPAPHVRQGEEARATGFAGRRRPGGRTERAPGGRRPLGHRARPLPPGSAAPGHPDAHPALSLPCPVLTAASTAFTPT